MKYLYKMALERGYQWKNICVRQCEKILKQNSAKIMHRNTALNLTFWHIYANIAIKHVFQCIDILGSSGGVENLPGNPANVNERKNMFDPYIIA